MPSHFPHPVPARWSNVIRVQRTGRADPCTHPRHTRSRYGFSPKEKTTGPWIESPIGIERALLRTASVLECSVANLFEELPDLARDVPCGSRRDAERHVVAVEFDFLVPLVTETSCSTRRDQPVSS